MTDAVTKTEMEDVLSSITRLVNERQSGSARKDSQASDERLVLTPKLRVAGRDVLRLTEHHAVAAAQDTKENRQQTDLRIGQSVPHKVVDRPLVLAENYRQDQALEVTDISDLTAKIAALETEIARTVDQWEPDGQGHDPYAGKQSPSMRWQEGFELDAKGNPVAFGKEKTETLYEAQRIYEESAETAIEEYVIDEEALRHLVAEIVREEFKGELGRRITRNVRKLVRQEVHRAMALRPE